LAAIAVPAYARAPTGLTIEDIFGRRLSEKNGLVLVDWEGPLANPAIEFFVVPPAGIAYPAKLIFRANGPRLSFNLPSQVGPQGPRKELLIHSGQKPSVYITIFPDEDGQDESYELTVDLVDARGRTARRKIPIRVIDQDRTVTLPTMPVTVDFSHDKTDFFKDAKRRQVAEQAVRDWAYYLDGEGLDPVPAGAEHTHLYRPEDPRNREVVTNPRDYRGILIYIYGYQTTDAVSGGQPAWKGGFQTRCGEKLQMRRSGSIDIDARGNRNRLGYLASLDSAECWKAADYTDKPNDLYTIILHEAGHALVFNPNNPLFARAKDSGSVADEALVKYLGGPANIDKVDHLAGVIDAESRQGAYGNEYHGEMPLSRRLLTKTHLLVAQAIGYRLRATAPFAPLSLETDTLPAAKSGVHYTAQLRASGGIPFYNWEIVGDQAKLPRGLRLDPFKGELDGVVSQPGKFEFTVRVRDYHKDGEGKEKTFVLEVKP
jgi:hypothetical protein